MSLAAARFSGKSALLERIAESEANQEVRDFLDGCYDLQPFWELSQEEAAAIVQLRDQYSHEELMEDLSCQGKSRGARYIAARILSGADPDLRQLTLDWFAHRNISRELSKGELQEIGARVADLRMLGIQFGWEARRFFELYRQVMVRDRVWGSCLQANQGKVKVLALTPNYNKLPVWVKKALINSDQWIETDRVGDIWRLVDCAKAWKHAPRLPKNVAEKVGRMPVDSRIMARWAWEKAAEDLNGLTLRGLHQTGWQKWYYGKEYVEISRTDLLNQFWAELKRLQNLSIAELISEWDSLEEYGTSREIHNDLRTIAEKHLGLPFGFLLNPWGRLKEATVERYLFAIAQHGDAKTVCKSLFGNGGDRTVSLFKSASQDAWQWAVVVGDRNADAIQKILGMQQPIVAFQADAVEFLRSMPMQTRLRLLRSTTFKYRGIEHQTTNDHVRDTGYLWSNLTERPDLGRIRCWFSAHEALAAAFVKELPDEVIPVPHGWERADGLCSVDASWTLEFPKSVATLKYYGQVLRHCVGGYGNAIKQGRSIVFVVREQGILTHCVEVCNGRVNQFYKSENSSPDRDIKESVVSALQQSGLL
jgi:PcfJ-like protein